MTLALPSLENRLAQASTPEETQKLESVSAAMIAYAKEQKDYEGYVNAVKLFILSRRKTTELYAPDIRPGVKGRNVGTISLSEIGFTKSQWHRRTKELELTDEQIEEYFDMVISNGWEPSRNDMFRYFREASGHYKPDPCICPKCGRSH